MSTRIRTGAVGLAAAAVLFVVYQTAAPRADETTLAGAHAWASPGWVIAHVAAILGFILVSFGLAALHLRLAATRAERPSFHAVVLGWLGVGLLLPYYGAEVYGLNAIGRRSVAESDPSLLSLGEDFRLDPTAATSFVLGLGLLGLAGLLAAVAVWRSGALPRWAAVPVAAVLVTLIPQFFVPQPVRVVHGLATALALLILAVVLWRPPLPVASS